MRWLKHLTMAHDDPEIAYILENSGPEAYGTYWLINEHVAAPMEPGKMLPSATHSAAKWASICHLSVRKWLRIVKLLSKRSLIVLESSEDRFQIAVPNILKYKDEYSKKSGHSPDKLHTREKAEGDIERNNTCIPPPADARVDASQNGNANPEPGSPERPALLPFPEEKNPPEQRTSSKIQEQWFDDEFWPLRWRPQNKQSAKKSFCRLAKNESQKNEIIAGTKTVRQRMLEKDEEFRPHMATFLNRKQYLDDSSEQIPQAQPASGWMGDPSHPEHGEYLRALREQEKEFRHRLSIEHPEKYEQYIKTHQII